jgi:hypothetical protein
MAGFLGAARHEQTAMISHHAGGRQSPISSSTKARASASEASRRGLERRVDGKVIHRVPWPMLETRLRHGALAR